MVADIQCGVGVVEIDKRDQARRIYGEFDNVVAGQKHIADMFDLIAGSSTGGILTMALTRPGSRGRVRGDFEPVHPGGLHLELVVEPDQVRAPSRVDVAELPVQSEEGGRIQRRHPQRFFQGDAQPPHRVPHRLGHVQGRARQSPLGRGAASLENQETKVSRRVD